ncbi:MAG: DNA polymerase IV [Balneolaceae bacterium]
MDPNQPSAYNPGQDVHRITLYSTVAREHQHRSLRKRLYLHLDMNCFYAQVEQRAYNLYGLPLAMGGWRKPDGTPRGIVATASYEARALGIKTAMSALEAWQICPYLVFMQIDYDKYQGISRQLKEIMERFSPDIEKYSMDEYFMDITFLRKEGRSEISRYVQRLKQQIYRELGLVASVGVADSKTYAKLASSLRKPDGMMILLTPDDAAQHLFSLPLDKVWGIGSRRYRKLTWRGITTIAEAHKAGPAPFRAIFGQMQGQLFYEIVTGQDRARVLDNDDHIPDEVSYMHTFSDWTTNTEQVRGEIVKAVRKVCYRLRGYGRRARRWGCHIRYQNDKWEGTTFAFGTPGYTNLDDYVLQECMPRALQVIRKALQHGEKIRGIGFHTIEMAKTDQIDLFFTEDDRMRRLYRATDCINNLFGADTVLKAAVRESVPGKTHFVSRS